jgi:hypothetical protein
MVQQTTLVSDTFSEIFVILNEEVSSIRNNSGDTIELDETDSGNYWLGSFPDRKLIEDADRYPIAVLNTPEFDESIIGFRRSETTLEIDITVYDTSAEHPPKFVEKAVACLRQSDKLEAEGFYNVQVVDTTKNVLTQQRADLKIHEYTATVSVGFELAV